MFQKPVDHDIKSVDFEQSMSVMLDDDDVFFSIQDEDGQAEEERKSVH